MEKVTYCVNGKECMEDRWEPPIKKREKEQRKYLTITRFASLMTRLNTAQTLIDEVADYLSDHNFDSTIEFADICDAQATLAAAISSFLGLYPDTGHDFSSTK